MPRTIHDVHERVLPAPAADVGRLLDTLSAPDDLLWRAGDVIPLLLDDGLRIGSRGGHGPVRYRVSAYAPGERVEFTFAPVTGIVGTHAIDVRPTPDGQAVLRHTLTGRPVGRMRVLWPLVVHALHDDVVEGLLDRGEAAVTGRRPARRAVNARARLVFGSLRRRVRTRPVPTNSTALGSLDRVDAADCWATRLLPADARDAGGWLAAGLRSWPAWVRVLMGLRHLAVAPLRLKLPGATARSELLLHRTATEAVIGLDDRHLSFRVGVQVVERHVLVTTAVQIHNPLGRTYWAAVRHLHPWVLRSMLRHVPRPLLPAGMPTGRAAHGRVAR